MRVNPQVELANIIKSVIGDHLSDPLINSSTPQAGSADAYSDSTASTASTAIGSSSTNSTSQADQERKKVDALASAQTQAQAQDNKDAAEHKKRQTREAEEDKEQSQAKLTLNKYQLERIFVQLTDATRKLLMKQVRGQVRKDELYNYIQNPQQAINANIAPPQNDDKDTPSKCSSPISSAGVAIGSLLESSVLSFALVEGILEGINLILKNSGKTLWAITKLPAVAVLAPVMLLGMIAGYIYKKAFISGGANDKTQEASSFLKKITFIWAVFYEGADAALTVGSTAKGLNPVAMILAIAFAAFAKSAKAMIYERPVALGDNSNKHAAFKHDSWKQSGLLAAQELGSLFIAGLHYQTTKLLLTEVAKAALGGALSGGISIAITAFSVLSGLGGHYFMNAYDLQGTKVTSYHLAKIIKKKKEEWKAEPRSMSKALSLAMLYFAYGVRKFYENTVEKYAAVRAAYCSIQSFGLATLYAAPILATAAKLAGAKGIAALIVVMAAAGPWGIAGLALIGVGLLAACVAITYKKYKGTKKYIAKAEAAEVSLELTEPKVSEQKERNGSTDGDDSTATNLSQTTGLVANSILNTKGGGGTSRAANDASGSPTTTASM